MNASSTITMPERFIYSANVDFNAKIVAALAAITSAGETIALDCAAMEYIDSAGIGLLVMSYKKAQKIGAKIAMVNVKKSVSEILILANLQKLIDIH